MVTISCGRSASTRRPEQQQRSTSLGAFIPKRFSTKSGVHQRRTTVVNPQQRTFRSNYRVPVTEHMKPNGRWTAKLQVRDATTVAHTTRIQPRIQVRVQENPQDKRNSRPCAYCKEDGCHIRTCDKLAAKKSRKAIEKKDVKKSFKDGAADRLAARIRQAQEEKKRQEEFSKQQEDEDSESSEGDFFNSSSEEEVDDEDFPALPTVAKVSKRVSFKDDSENLMKPPCDTKVFNNNYPASTISDEEEEEEIVLKSSANAWKPRRQRNGITTHERQLILDQIKEKELELAAYSVDSWADACEIEELEEEIKNLNAKLD